MSQFIARLDFGLDGFFHEGCRGGDEIRVKRYNLDGGNDMPLKIYKFE